MYWLVRLHPDSNRRKKTINNRFFSKPPFIKLAANLAFRAAWLANRAYTLGTRTGNFPRSWQGHFDSVSSYFKRGAAAAAATVGGYFASKMVKRRAPPAGGPRKRQRRGGRRVRVRTGRKIPVSGGMKRKRVRSKRGRGPKMGVVEVNPHGGEHIETKAKSGRKMKRSKLTYKMALVASEKNIDRYQAITYPKANMGFYLMDRQTNTNQATGAVLENMPLYLFELGTFGQNVAATAGAAGWRLQITTSPTGTAPMTRHYSFTTLTSQTVNANTLNPGGYYLEDSNTNYKHRRALFEWSDIRIEFIAPSAVPTKLYLEIVQFKEDGLLPDVDSNTIGMPSAATSPTPQQKIMDYFYDNLTSKLVNGPLWVNNPGLNLKKYMKVLYRKSISCDAQQFDRSTITALSGQERVIKIFKYFNRVMQFDRTAGNALPTLTASTAAAPLEIPLSVQQVIGGQLTATELGNRRIFLMLRAENSYTSPNSESLRPGICPSFDILIRNKMVTSEDTRS